MKRTNHSFVIARLMLLVLTLAITVFSFASCEGLPPELQGLLGGNPNASCEHEYDNKCDTDCNKCGAVLIGDLIGSPTHYYDNACDTDCNECGATREIEHTYVDGVCSVCGAIDESVPACQHTNVENCVCKDCNASVHNVEFIPYNAPACHKNGNYEFYLCRDCNGFFSDAEAKNELTGTDKINIQIIGLEHSYDDGHDTVCNACDFEREPVHTFDNACDPDCNVCGATFTKEHVYVDGACVLCGAVDESVSACEHTTVENCVCGDCGASVHGETTCLPAMAPTCDNTGIRYDVYICVDCENAAFSDAEGKNEITDVSSVIIPPLGHNKVGGVCERCGSYNDGNNNDSNHPGEPTPFELACRELVSLYGPDNKKATSSDYELVSKIVIEGEEFAVTWTIANESITITYDESKGVYVVDVPDQITKNCYYSIEAAINNNNGRTIKYQFIRLLEKNASAHQHPGVENCVCNSCNEAVHNIEFVSAKSPTCEDFGNIDFYICMDCNKLFSDAEAKNEITSSVVISAIGGEHNYVNGTCDKCGSSDPFGGTGDGQGGASESSSES